MGKFKDYEITHQELEQRIVTSPDGQSCFVIPDYYQLLDLMKMLKESNDEATNRNLESPECSRYSDQHELSISVCRNQESP